MPVFEAGPGPGHIASDSRRDMLKGAGRPHAGQDGNGRACQGKLADSGGGIKAGKALQTQHLRPRMQQLACSARAIEQKLDGKVASQIPHRRLNPHLV